MATCTVLVLAEPGARWTALCRTVRSLPEARLVGRVTRVADALDLARQHPPDLLIASADLPREPVVPLLTILRRAWPQLRYLLLGTDYPAAQLVPLIGRRFAGYLRWPELTTALLLAHLTVVVNGGAVSSSDAVVEALVEALRHHLSGRGGEDLEASNHTPASLPTSALLAELTPRELEVLALLRSGLSNREIAEQLVVSAHTERDYVKSIYRKLAVHTRAQVLAKLANA